MQNIRVLIVEDEWIVSEEIKLLMEFHGYQVVGQAEDDLGAMDVLKDQVADVVLMDINIKGKQDGIDLAELIHKKYRCAIIFLTAYANEQFLSRAKKIKPAAYILKPFEERNLLMAVEIAFNNMMDLAINPQIDEYKIDAVFIKESSRFKKMELKDILYAKASGSYTEVVARGNKTTLAINLKHFEEQLGTSRFMRVHRSFVVNLDNIEEFEGNQIFINKVSIPISPAYRKGFLDRLRIV